MAPWLTLIGKSAVHFKSANTNLSPLFNAMASVFATALYTFYMMAGPPEWVLKLGIWKPLILAMSFGLLYILLFIYRGSLAEKLRWKWLIGVALVSYCALFTSLALAFVAPALSTEYYLYAGTIFDSQGNPAGDARILFFSCKGPEEAETGSQAGEALSYPTDANGKFLAFVSRKEHKINWFAAKSETETKMGNLAPQPQFDLRIQLK